MTKAAISKMRSKAGRAGKGKCKARPKAHYQMMVKKMWERHKKPLTERFWSKVAIGGKKECWPFNGARCPLGYGRFNLNGASRVASCVAWELKRGEIPAGLFVLHDCDNPPCCNPDHLFIGTKADNSRQMVERGRQISLHGEDAPGAILTERLIREIRKLHQPYVCTAPMLAKRFGINLGTLKNALYQACWKHVEKRPVKDTSKWCKGERNPVAILNTKQVLSIRKLYDGGMRLRDLVPMFGVSRGCIAAIVKRHNWRHI